MPAPPMGLPVLPAKHSRAPIRYAIAATGATDCGERALGLFAVMARKATAGKSGHRMWFQLEMQPASANMGTNRRALCQRR